MTPTTPTQPTQPVQPAGDLARSRYGRRGPLPRRRLLLVGGLVAAVVLGYLLYVAFRVENPALRYQDLGYAVLSDGQAQVTFDVTFAGRVDGARQAACTLEAQNELHTTVGLRDITVGPASRRRLRVTAQLPTSERATTVTVDACALR